ncbi:MAG: LD-carboxypeptidase [Catenulisporales bacterium]|jgi:muramoyltetrapeptide carboxypeptidase|nr:LD-carboxypeptidase [Catenulisporales bacterium]
MRSLLSPPALKPGDRVAVVALSGSPGKQEVDLGLAALRSVGLVPEVFPSVRSVGPYPYLAADDKVRAEDLTRALGQPGYAAVFCARGGYGVQRVLELVDWQAIGAPQPRVVVGFSDVTALIEAVRTHLGWVSVYGPMVSSVMFRTGVPSFEGLARLLLTPEKVTELVFQDTRVLVPGIAEGVTVGGTAALIASSLGTSTSVPARDGILFLEDVAERNYRLDRVLTQLRRSGYLDGVRGILCGTWEDCGPLAEVEQLLADRLGDLGVPVLLGADIGHGVFMQSLPMGLRARLDTEAATLTFAEPALVAGE